MPRSTYASHVVVVVVTIFALTMVAFSRIGGGDLEPTTTLLCSALVGVAATVAAFIELVSTRQRRLPKDLIFVLASIVLLAAIEVASIQWSVLPAASRTSAAATIALALSVWLGWFVRRHGNERSVLHAIAITIGVVLLAAIGIRAFDGDTAFAFTARLSEPIMHPNLLGAYAVAAIVVGHFESRQRQHAQSLFGWALVALGAFVLPLTSSRSAEAIAVFVVIVLIAWRPVPKLLLLGTFIVIAVSVGVGAWWSETPAFQSIDFSLRSAGAGLALTAVACVVFAVLVGVIATRFWRDGRSDLAIESSAFSRRQRGALYTGIVAASLVTTAAVIAISMRVVMQGRESAARLSTVVSDAGPQEGIRMSLSANNRDYWWYVAWKAFEAKPWLGWGAATFRPI